MIDNATVGLGILSYKALNTLKKTLDSYKRNNILEAFDEQCIYFNDFSAEDRAISEKYGFQSFGSSNIGFKAEEPLARAMKSDYVLLTQNDCPTVVGLKETLSQLRSAVELLRTGKIHMMHLRHQWQVGEGFIYAKEYSDFYNIKLLHHDFLFEQNNMSKDDIEFSYIKKIKKYIRPGKAKRLAGRSVYIERYPEKLYPDLIQKEGEILIVDSECLYYTEQSFLIERVFFLDVICDYINKNPRKRTLHGFQVPEYILNCRWWRQQHFKIGISTGIFSHNRFDDSFRKNHLAYNKDI